MTRAVTLLDAIAAAGGELGTNALSRATGINASTVSRILATLVEGGLLEHRPDTGRYRLGLRLVQFGNAALDAFDLFDAARERMDELAEATGETASLSVPGEGVASTVGFARSDAAVQSIARIGRPSVAHATSVGKVYLAWGGQLPEGPLEAHTPHTVTDRDRVAAEVAEVLQRGWAQADAERDPDLASIAAPVLDQHGKLAAILGVQGPAGRFDAEARRAAVPVLLDAATSLSVVPPISHDANARALADGWQHP